MKLRSLVAVVLLFAVPAGAASLPFGSRVSNAHGVKAPFLTVDLNGDGVADQVYLVSVSTASKTRVLAPGVTIISKFWSSQPLGDRSAQRAIAIELGKDKGKFLITGYQGEGTAFFDSPVWEAPDKPLAIGKYKLRNAILVGTEAGIDTSVYWTGKTFALYEPIEEP